jgi:5-(carboxyamino)imidazole ribonucleotide synthase
MTALPPGSTIGIIGGGQLGRMLALAAAPLGYRVHIYAPDRDSCAAEVAADFTCAAYDDRAALAAFAGKIDVATFEFENVDPAALVALGKMVPLHPPVSALEIGQDRIAEKRFASELGGTTARWHPVDSRADLDVAIAAVGTPSILKTVRMGYDGKGQARLMSANDADAAWEALQGQAAILEEMVKFDHEFSLIVARDQQGRVAFWDAPKNVHVDGILATSTVPAAEAIREHILAARALVRKMAEKLGYVGVFAIEFFGGAEGPVFNEMAPRVHNSGHWTIEGAVTSQFENHIRAICGLPLGAVALTASQVEMRNLIGSDVDQWAHILAEPGAHLHLYGKGEASPGRKMGHVTRLRSAG